MNFIVDEIASVVSRMRPANQDEAVKRYGPDFVDYISSQGLLANIPKIPYYMYGHRLEIANRLKEKNADKVFKYQKYPLIALRLDTPEEVSNGIWKYTLNVAILASTEKKYNAEERYSNVFKPVLYHLYENLLKELGNVGFTWSGNLTYPEHTKIDRPFWGISGSEGNTKNIFDDPLDAIELIDLKINKRIKNC